MAKKANKFTKDKLNSSLLPYVLDLLSRRQDLSIFVDDLCEEIKDAVLYEHISAFGTVRNAVNFALEVGMDLGIISLVDERVRVPFNFRMKKKKSKTTENLQRLKSKEPNDASENTAEEQQTAVETRKSQEVVTKLPTTARRPQAVRRRLERRVRTRTAAKRYVGGNGYKSRNTAGRRKPTVRAVHHKRGVSGNKKKNRKNARRR